MQKLGGGDYERQDFGHALSTSVVLNRRVCTTQRFTSMFAALHSKDI